MTWHESPDVLTRYATRPHDLDDATASSVEVHLLGCDACRRVVAAGSVDADGAALAAEWADIVDRIDRPAPTWLERILRRAGVGEATSRLVGATRSLQASWAGATVATVAGVVALARGDAGDGPFLAVAPVLPLVLVAVSFGSGSEPSGEVGATVPLRGAGLVLRRAVAVLAMALTTLTLGAVALPGLAPHDAAWVLPALGLSLGTLALATWVRVEVAAAALTAAWLVVLWAAALVEGDRVPASDLVPFAAPGQLTFLALAGVASVVLMTRRDAFTSPGRTA